MSEEQMTPCVKKDGVIIYQPNFQTTEEIIKELENLSGQYEFSGFHFSYNFLYENIEKITSRESFVEFLNHYKYHIMAFFICNNKGSELLELIKKQASPKGCRGLAVIKIAKPK